MEAATTTLADSLLDDLDDLDDVEEINDNKDEEDKKLNENDEWSKHSQTLPKRKRLLDDPDLQKCLNEIDDGKNEEEKMDFIQLCNRYLSKLDIELQAAHLELVELYNSKFPELADLIVDKIQYKNTIQALQNVYRQSNHHLDFMSNEIQTPLNQILNSNQILTISVAATTSNATQIQLTTEQNEQIQSACDYMDQIQICIQNLQSYISSQMSQLCPNTCALLGSTTLAAILLGLAGGLAELSNIPACNLQVLGQVKQNANSRAGMSSMGLSLHNNQKQQNTNNSNNTQHLSQPHTGILYNTDLVQKCPMYLKKKALKTVASKLALAIRCDYVNVTAGRNHNHNNVNGLKFRQEIEAKILKWEEPDKARVLKALPKPDLTTKKRRGGKRMRRLKERFEETELMKQANKRAFSTKVGEYGDDAMGLTLGMLDTKESTGAQTNIKNTTQLLQQAKNKRMKLSNTKASRQHQLQQIKQQQQMSSSNGLASSMVFTPIQGLELVNPDAQRERVKAANTKWFSENAGFQSAHPK